MPARIVRNPKQVIVGKEVFKSTYPFIIGRTINSRYDSLLLTNDPLGYKQFLIGQLLFSNQDLFKGTLTLQNTIAESTMNIIIEVVVLADNNSAINYVLNSPIQDMNRINYNSINAIRPLQIDIDYNLKSINGNNYNSGKNNIVGLFIYAYNSDSLIDQESNKINIAYFEKI